MARASASELREDIERRRAEVVKRLNEIARARAEIAALEEALRARVRDDELDRLERVLRSPTSSDEFAEVTTGVFAVGRTSASEGESEGEGEGESEEEEATAESEEARRSGEDGEDGGAPIEAEQDLETVHREGEGVHRGENVGAEMPRSLETFVGRRLGRGGEGERDETRERRVHRGDGAGARKDRGKKRESRRRLAVFRQSHERRLYQIFQGKIGGRKGDGGKEARLVAQQAGASERSREADKEKPTKSHRARR